MAEVPSWISTCGQLTSLGPPFSSEAVWAPLAALWSVAPKETRLANVLGLGTTDSIVLQAAHEPPRIAIATNADRRAAFRFIAPNAPPIGQARLITGSFPGRPDFASMRRL